MPLPRTSRHAPRTTAPGPKCSPAEHRDQRPPGTACSCRAASVRDAWSPTTANRREAAGGAAPVLGNKPASYSAARLKSEENVAGAGSRAWPLTPFRRSTCRSAGRSRTCQAPNSGERQHCGGTTTPGRGFSGAPFRVPTSAARRPVPEWLNQLISGRQDLQTGPYDHERELTLQRVERQLGVRGERHHGAAEDANGSASRGPSSPARSSTSATSDEAGTEDRSPPSDTVEPASRRNFLAFGCARSSPVLVAAARRWQPQPAGHRRC
jgi:hypothetical protein